MVPFHKCRRTQLCAAMPLAPLGAARCSQPPHIQLWSIRLTWQESTGGGSGKKPAPRQGLRISMPEDEDKEVSLGPWLRSSKGTNGTQQLNDATCTAVPELILLLVCSHVYSVPILQIKSQHCLSLPSALCNGCSGVMEARKGTGSVRVRQKKLGALR